MVPVPKAHRHLAGEGGAAHAKAAERIDKGMMIETKTAERHEQPPCIAIDAWTQPRMQWTSTELGFPAHGGSEPDPSARLGTLDGIVADVAEFVGETGRDVRESLFG